MAPVFSLMTCVMLFLAVEHSVQAADSITVNESTLKSTLEDALAKCRNSSGGGLGAVVAQLVTSVTSMKADLQKTTTDLQKTTLDLQKTKLKLQKTQKDLEADKDIGSTFVRWGRKTCPAKTTLVYSGVAGGKQYNQKGSGTNRLCLTRSPQFDNTPIPPHYGYLYGAEYEAIRNHHDHDVPCSLCRAPQSTTIMMAATLTCPPGWTAQYTGHLTSAHSDHYATEYVCLDRNPENDYSGGLKGVAGGKHYNQAGSGTNRLCLTRSPQFDNTPVPSGYGYLYGAEYEDIRNHHQHDVPCSLCRAPQSTTIMMAATLTCAPGWTAQYTGHLTAARHDHYATEYVCLDRNPENDFSGGLKNENGLLFHHVITQCGSLPCPPYKNKKVVTCVVCSM